MAGQASWEQLDNRFYRKVEVYEMDWVHKDGGEGIGLEQYTIAVGHMGGSIGMTFLVLICYYLKLACCLLVGVELGVAHMWLFLCASFGP